MFLVYDKPRKTALLYIKWREKWGEPGVYTDLIFKL